MAKPDHNHGGALREEARAVALALVIAALIAAWGPFNDLAGEAPQETARTEQ